MKAYILIGPPGSGKGTLSKRCIEQFGWKQLSTGNLCRMHVAQETEIGKQIDAYLKAGKLMSDELIAQMVDAWLSDVTKGKKPIILDGFPRTINQAKILYELTKEKYPLLQLSVIRFIISDEAAIDRICNRFICNNTDCQAVYSGKGTSGLGAQKNMQCDMCGAALSKREDDVPEVIQGRLSTYRKYEQHMLNYFTESKQPVHEFEVERPFNEIFSSFLESVVPGMHDTDKK